MNRIQSAVLFSAVLLAPLACFAATFIPTADELACRSDEQKAADAKWTDRLLAGAAPGAKYVQVDDMLFPVAALREKAGFYGNLWPEGKVYYTFADGLGGIERNAWVRGATLWSAVAEVTFIKRTDEPNYILVGAFGGDYSAVGMVGGEQPMSISRWFSEFVVAHEVGHALGLHHEHQRTDRDDYVVILTENLIPGYEDNFDIWPTVNLTAYDFDSLMHYPRDAMSINGLNTIEPKPAYSQWLNLMGLENYISVLDAWAMAQRYGGLGTLQAPELTARMGQYQPGDVSLVWSAVPGATGYRVFYEEVDDGPPYTPVQDGSPASGTNVGNITEKVIRDLNPGQRYYFTIKAVTQVLESDYAAPANARSLAGPEDDAYAPNDSMGTAYDLSAQEQTWLSNLLGLGIQRTYDWYRISVKPGDLRVRIQCRFKHNDGDITIALYNQYGSTLDQNYRDSGSEFINYVVTQPGTYYIKVGGDYTSNTYDLWWEDAPPDAPCPKAGDVDASGAVDALDVQLVTNAALGQPVPTTVHPDVDYSGTTDAADAALDINASLGREVDLDGDGLCDIAEENLGSDLAFFDTDGDGVGDGQEVLDGTDPKVPD